MQSAVLRWCPMVVKATLEAPRKTAWSDSQGLTNILKSVLNGMDMDELFRKEVRKSIDAHIASSRERIENLRSSGDVAAAKDLEQKIGKLEEMLNKPLELVDYASLRNEDYTGGQVTPAQHKDNYIAADAFQNFDFRRDKDGKVVVSANATGVYNVSAGAHEYFHALVKEILNTYQISLIREKA